MLGIVKNGHLIWEESGEPVPLHPGSYFSPNKWDKFWKYPVENVKVDKKFQI